MKEKMTFLAEKDLFKDRNKDNRWMWWILCLMSLN